MRWFRSSKQTKVTVSILSGSASIHDLTALVATSAARSIGYP